MGLSNRQETPALCRMILHVMLKYYAFSVEKNKSNFLVYSMRFSLLRTGLDVANIDLTCMKDFSNCERCHVGFRMF